MRKVMTVCQPDCSLPEPVDWSGISAVLGTTRPESPAEPREEWGAQLAGCLHWGIRGEQPMLLA
jgi:hypothetical protein